MIAFLVWYILITVSGLLALPVAYRIFYGLPDRGYTLARPFGMLIWGYAFWLLASLQIIGNDTGGVILALVLLAGWGVWSLRKIDGQEFKAWVVQSRSVMVAGEFLFLLFFAFWAVIRSASPAIVGTEKPMELAFINAILRSPTFPPHDPWLSGYAISYYYFGYVMVAMLARLSGVVGSVAFNLASALWFALTALAAYGILYNLIAFKHKDTLANEKRSSPLWAWLAPLFVLILGNLGGFLEMLHARGLFWQKAADGSWKSSFWTWLDVQELVNPPAEPFSWVPKRVAGFWWWRASRILQDYDLAKNSKEIIDEFPFFSYLLADLHPHVLAMPFALLAIGLALNFYYVHLCQSLSIESLIRSIWRWFANQEVNWSTVNLVQWVRKSDFWVTAVALGGLAFLNTWDFPIYIALFCSVIVFLLYRQAGWENWRIVDFLEMFFVLALAGVVLYFPFYIGFRSQAGGIIPSLIFFTRGVHFWLMFAPLLVPIFIWLIWLLLEHGAMRPTLRTGIKFASISVFGLWGLSFLLGWIAANLANWGNLLLLSAEAGTPLSRIAELMLLTGNLYLSVQGAASASLLVGMAFALRLAMPGTWLTLFILLALVWGLLARGRSSTNEDKQRLYGAESQRLQAIFVLLLVLVGAGLTLAPEFVYLRDQFGWRMNTIFKFYFQAWILWAIVAAYSSVVLWRRLKNVFKGIFGVGWSLLLSMALVYPVFGIQMRIQELRAGNPTLDGAAYLERGAPDEMSAIRWLRQQPMGVVAEAVGGSYSGYARVSTYTGLPTVLGWPGHESQWRGGAREMGTREEDIRLLYRTPNWAEAKAIIERYNIRYIYIGAFERNTYRVNETKFREHLKAAFVNDTVIIYVVPEG